jgi:hypothetical protein
MFRALAALQNDGGQTHGGRKEGFASMDQSGYIAKQTAIFNQQYPNMVLTGIPTSSTDSPQRRLASAGEALRVWDPETRQSTLRDIDIAQYATSVDANLDLQAESQRCKTTSLDSLLNTQDPTKKLRCGWIYKKGKRGDRPATSEGALGTREKPAGFIQSPDGTWIWNLDEAKMRVLGDKCEAMTSCKDVGSAAFQGCAYSKTRGIGVPVDSQGNLLYPREPKYSAPQNSLVVNPANCPAPPAVGSPQYQLQRSRDVCTPLADGKLSRDCMLQQITAAGCKVDGSLYKALVSQALPNNYAAGLQSLTSFQKYQQLASKPILDSVLRDGSTTVQTALGTFRSLADESTKVGTTALNFAARDLCLNRGAMDEYDFCDDLNSNSIAPFALECLQKAFLRAGGQQSGAMYPSSSNHAEWNGLGRWQTVLDRIQQLKSQTMSKNEGIQRGALKAFMGIAREPYATKQIAKIQGIEVLWFNRGSGTFIGRRIQTGLKADFPRLSTSGEVDGTSLNDFVEYLALTNLRPPTAQSIRMRLESDDGILYTINKEADGQSTRGKYMDSADSFGANWDQAPTRYDAKTCWNLKANGPNYINGWWQETGGYAHSQVFYSPCNALAWQPLPADWFSLTQEVDAPMLSWQATDFGFVERRMPSYFELIQNGTQILNTNRTDLPYSNLLQFTPKTGLASLKKSIAMNAWRTLTLSFIPGSNATSSILLSNGTTFTIRIVGQDMQFEYMSATLKATHVARNVLVLDGKTAHYLYINMRSDFDSHYPNRITFAIAPHQSWLNGSIQLGVLGNAVQSFTTAGNQPLFNKTDSMQLLLGDKNRIITAAMQIGFLRIFDYELDNRDILRDIKNDWQMAYFM